MKELIIISDFILIINTLLFIKLLKIYNELKKLNTINNVILHYLERKLR